MATNSQPTYDTLDRPYDNDLNRAQDPIINMNATEQSDSGVSSGAAQNGTPPPPVIGGNFTDLYIETFIKSRGYIPKTSGFYFDGKTGYIEAMKLFVGSGGITGGKLDIPDITSMDSFHVEPDGDTFWGTTPVLFAADPNNAPAYILKSGVFKFQSGTIAGGSNVSFISDTLDTATKAILKDFTFSSADYSGAFKSGDITWNATTGAITGGSGILMYKGGIVGANAGVSTFSINGVTGSAVFAGSLSAASGTLGTITTGLITLDTAGYIRGGQTAYNTSTGFFLGYSGVAYKFSIGNPSGDYLTWDGVDLTVSAPINVFQKFTAYETLTAGDLLKIIDDAGTAKLAKVIGYGTTANVVAYVGTRTEVVPKAINITTDKIFVFYIDDVQTNANRWDRNYNVICGTLSGRTVTWGSKLTVITETGTIPPGFANPVWSFIDMVAVSTTTVGMAFYRNDVSAGDQQRIDLFGITISGTALTNAGNTTMVNYDATYTYDAGYAACKVDTDKICVIYDKKTIAGGAQNTKAIVSSWGGASWTIGAEYSVVGGVESTAAVWQLGTNRLLFTYGTTGDTVTNSGTTLSAVASSSLPASSDNHILNFTSTSTGVCLYKNGTTLYIAKCTESAGALTFTNTTTVATGITDIRSIPAEAGIMLVQKNGANYWYVHYDNNIKSCSMTTSDGFQISPTYNPITPIEAMCFATINRIVILSSNLTTDFVVYTAGDMDLYDLIGFAKETIAAAGTGKLQTNSGINTSQAGLTTGVLYYLTPQAVLVLSATASVNSITVNTRQIGYAVGTTKLLINIP